MNVSLNPPLRPLHFGMINLVKNPGYTSFTQNIVRSPVVTLE
ncbi:MAG: hypothetical protein V7L26_13170 [Nostoc sp.]